MTLTATRHALETVAPSPRRRWTVKAAHACVGWFLCGVSMWIGMAVTTIETAQVIHAIAAPIFFFAVSWFYFTRYDYSSPLATATFFVSFVIAMDVVVVALIVERSFEMFRSALGTWIPFGLIFSSTYLTGRWVEGRTG